MAISSACFFFFLCSLFLSHGVLELEASHHVDQNLQVSSTTPKYQPYRTSYHFQPPKNWINGPMVYRGIYHLMYQYNPKGAVWGNIVWAHSTSTDLVNWTPHDPAIYPSQPSDINGCWSGELDDTKYEYYTIGTYNPDKDIYVPDNGSVESDLGLRILWGWLNESSILVDDIKKGWAGVQAIPRTIWLDKSRKQLVQWPIAEIEKLRGHQVHLPQQVLKGGLSLEVSGVTAAQADVVISFKVSDLGKAEVLDPSWTNPQVLCSKKSASVKGSLGPFGLLVLASKGLQEYTAVFYRIFKGQNKYVVLMCSDQSRSSLNNSNDKTSYGAFLDVDPIHEELSLRSLIDHSIVESFGGGGKAVIAARVYPTLAIDGQAHLQVFNNGTENVQITSMSAWSMKKAQIS
ncbi:fructan 6-exohydrolase [Quercus suber]|uniref:Fructan 6-exohydrolase n=1 Tax=Quercus suber TaxID=58331 RepID=A0AAW0KHN2_QUESU